MILTIARNIEEINNKRIKVALKANRNPDEVLLMAVTKLHTAAEINEAVSAGITDIGENKVQELLSKYDDVLPVKWHLIGHLQTNKVKSIIDKVVMIHSVDSVHIASEIDKRAKQNDLVMDVLIQINSAMETTKFGIESDETSDLIREISEKFENIRIRGIMCIPPYEVNPEDAREYFKEAKENFEKLKSKKFNDRVSMDYLSMGMSNDFEVAIEEGSNIVRVGTSIFGNRDYR
ncbi:MAG: YggS family pyridoxal phosphate-dependent enzyme [Peptostreptococcaceae bacterium]|nr:YggS family pyridoxal phosphate-dependent enzyme [Peptostreptococcaceae bacterium]